MLLKIIRVSSWGVFQWKEPSKANRIRQGGVMFRDWGAVQLGHSMQVDEKVRSDTRKSSLGTDYSKFRVPG